MTFGLLRRLEQHAGTHPHRVAARAVDERGGVRELTWSQLRTATETTAAHLTTSADASAVVLLQRPTGLELLVDLLGGLRAGRAVLPLPAAMPPPEVAALWARIGVAGAAPPAVLPGLEGSLLLCSSGTTGAPKIVRRAQRALDALAEACASQIGIDANDTLLLPIPLHHSYGIDMGLLTAIHAGCCLEIHERFQGALVLDALATRSITILPAVPMIFDGLARLARHGKTSHVLRRAFSAGSPLPQRIHDAFADGFGVRLGQIYGATEFGSLTFNDPELPGFDPLSAGVPIGAAEIRIVDAQEPKLEQSLSAGEVGQLAVRAPSMLCEYVADATPATQDGFFLPGDLGRMDRSGKLMLTGRLKLLIDMGSVKVNPFEIEAVLGEHPGVKEVVVIGVAASDTVSRLKAVVVPEEGREPTAAELRDFARERLIHYKVPRSFDIRSDVPRSPTGKILRQVLQAQLGRGAP